MILAIDIGNTNIVAGCIQGDEILFVERIKQTLQKQPLNMWCCFRH